MDSRSDAPSRGFWKGLAHLLHLPPAKIEYTSKDVAPAFGAPTISPPRAVSSFPPARAPSPSPPARAAPSSPPAQRISPTPVASFSPRVPTPKVTQRVSPAPVPASVWKEETPVPNKMGDLPIITDYDRIYELVKRRQSMKLDEIARVLALKEEQVAQELQTLEDNGLVDVKYPAFGEPLIVFKKPEA